MKTTQNKRTLNDILRYIKLHSKGDMLRESMMSIAQNTGYSNATVHRAIQQLQIEGLIQVIPTKSPRKPNSICYIGPDQEEVSTLLEKANVAIGNLYQASNEVRDIMIQLHDTISLLEGSQDNLIELH